MKTTIPPAPVITCTLLASAAFIFAQGSLTPPGAPAPTMKTLEQIEPRKEINPVNAPGDADSSFRITQPGSYFLTGNLTGVAGRHGIEIAANDVTVDLMGFALQGVAGSLGGIAVTENVGGITIRNGAARGWGQSGVVAGNAKGCLLENLHATSNLFGGILAGENATVRDCTARLNTGVGISVAGGSTITRCTAGDNTTGGIVGGGFGVVISQCAAETNGGRGVFANHGSTVSDCAARNNAGDGISVSDHCVVKSSISEANTGTAEGIVAGANASLQHCTATNNPGDGIVCGDGSTLAHCVAAQNRGSAGIAVGDGCTLTHCAARLNTSAGAISSGIEAGQKCALLGCTASDNTNTFATVSATTGVGLRAGAHSTVRGCTSEGNKAFQIEVNGPGCVIAENTFGQNPNNSASPGGGLRLTAEAHYCRVDGNHCLLASPSFKVEGTSNLIVRNSSFRGPLSLEYSVAAGNHLAQLIQNPGANFTATNPWANFEF